jgi:hypothetical protein
VISFSMPARPVAVALVALCVIVSGVIAPAEAVAAGGPKVVVVVGPTGRSNALYKREAREIVAEARRYTSNVLVVFTPNATWARVKRAAQGASIFVYFGHGNGYPSRYGPYQGRTKNGMGLDPASGANGTRHVNYGEDRIKASIRFARNAAVLLYRLCYASGNTEPGLSVGTMSQVRRRVDNYGAGFLAAGARVVIADGHPWPSPANYMRQLFRTDRSVWQMFKAAPNYHGHIRGPYASKRRPGMRFALDPNRGGSRPSGFYRSIVGDLSLRTTVITGRAVTPTPTPIVTPDPTPDVSAQPSPDPGPEPTPDPTPEVSAQPSPDPGPEPTPDPTPEVSAQPSPDPGPEPTPDPTVTSP